MFEVNNLSHQKTIAPWRWRRSISPHVNKPMTASLTPLLQPDIRQFKSWSISEMTDPAAGSTAEDYNDASLSLHALATTSRLASSNSFRRVSTADKTFEFCGGKRKRCEGNLKTVRNTTEIPSPSKGITDENLPREDTPPSGGRHPTHDGRHH